MGHETESFLPGYELLEALNIDPMAAVHDLDCVWRQGAGAKPAEQAQARQLLQLAQFSSCFWLLESSILLVNDNFDQCTRTSPLSFLCTQLALTLLKDSGCIVLHFFCGQHESEMDPVRGPQGLLRAITTQLLYSGHDFSHGFINTRAYSKAIRNHVIEDLCVTFRLLITQLPLNQKVLCIIDNISRFEREEWREDLGYVVEMLYRITEDQSFKPNLKVLITGATTRTRTELSLPPNRRMLLAKRSPYSYCPISERTVLSNVQTRKPSYQEKIAMFGADSDSEEDCF